MALPLYSRGLAGPLSVRSMSDLRLSDRPTGEKFNDNDTYRIMVLRSEQSEEEIDRFYLQKALELGIETSQDAKSTLDLPDPVDPGGTSLRFDSIAGKEPEHHARGESRIDARKSQSIHAPSDSSVESRGHKKTPSLAATSVASVPSSVTSAGSTNSNYMKFKNGIKRLSTIKGKRKVLQAQPSAPDLLIRPSSSQASRPEISQRAKTFDRLSTFQRPQSPPFTSPPLSPKGRPTGRRKVNSMAISNPFPLQHPYIPFMQEPPSYQAFPAPFRARTPPLPPLPPDTVHQGRPPSPEAISRSLTSPRLRHFRTAQLQEQLRFISFRASQIRFMRARHSKARQDHRSNYDSAKAVMEDKHADTLADLEHRHLSAEEDLHTALEHERQACDTRLRHMQAYCNPQENIDRGIPTRQVTQEDHRKLQNQFHARGQMDNLHTSRVNVLRERQAKQTERIVAKQEKELEALAEEFSRYTDLLEAELAQEGREIRREFDERRARLVHRWDLAEAVERRTLELETGENYAPLPEIGWGDEGKDGEEAEGEIERLFKEKKIIFDPNEGVFLEEEEEDEEEAKEEAEARGGNGGSIGDTHEEQKEVTTGARHETITEAQEFDEDNVI